MDENWGATICFEHKSPTTDRMEYLITKAEKHFEESPLRVENP